jgi:hypothetical protein
LTYSHISTTVEQLGNDRNHIWALVLEVYQVREGTGTPADPFQIWQVTQRQQVADVDNGRVWAATEALVLHVQILERSSALQSYRHVVKAILDEAQPANAQFKKFRDLCAHTSHLVSTPEPMGLGQVQPCS